MYHVLTEYVHFVETIIIACSYLYFHPHVAALSELAELKQLFQAQVSEKGELKLKESQTSLVKVS